MFGGVERIADLGLERTEPPPVEHPDQEVADEAEVERSLWSTARLKPQDVVVDADRVAEQRPDDGREFAATQPLVLGVE